MSSPDFVQLVVQLAVLLGTAVLCGQAMRALRQPAVLGEMLGGVVLGPSLLGTLAPSLFAAVFGAPASITSARDAIAKLGMLFFLFVAGLETDVSDLRRRGHQAVYLGLTGTLVPLLAGIALVRLLPAGFWRPGAG